MRCICYHVVGYDMGDYGKDDDNYDAYADDYDDDDDDDKDDDDDND